MSKLINCKSCNAEIAKSAKVCPQCGAKNKKPIYARPLVWVLAIFLVIFAAGINGLSQNIPTSSSDSPKLTLEKYNQIQNGMTYEEVINIIGFGVSPEVEMGEKGSELYTASYRYMGNDQVKGSIGANASFMFQGGKLNTKSQLGLE